MKKKKEIKSEYLYLHYSQIETGGEVREGELGPYACREDSNREQIFYGLYTKKSENVYDYDTIEYKGSVKYLIGKEVYVVIVKYDTGDSFGKSNGHFYAEGVYHTEEEATEIASLINKSRNVGYDKESPYRKKTGRYEPWRGYFERLNGAKIHIFKVREELTMNAINIYRH